MDESPADSLVFSEPGVGDDSSQYGREVAEAAEGMVDSGGQVLVPVQVGEEVKSQQRCEHIHTHTHTHTHHHELSDTDWHWWSPIISYKGILPPNCSYPESFISFISW